MSGVDADFSEYDALAGKLIANGAQLTRRCYLVVHKATYDTARDGQADTPVDTGNLKSSFVTEVKGLEGATGPTAEYGEYVHDGTSRQAPQPFLLPHMDKHGEAMLTAIEKIGEELLS